MALPSAASFYAAQQRRTLAALAATRAEWGKLHSLSQFDSISTRLLAIITSAQIGAATDGADYVPRALAEQGQQAATSLEVVPASLAGWATDLNEPEVYRPLETLLGYVPTKAAEQVGLAQQLAAGGQFLDTIVHTQITDAGRIATGLAIASRPGVGWVRHVNPPCCQNCGILAGKWFRSNHGFQRHHGCDCVHVPCASGEIPDGYTDTIAPDQIHDLTEAQRKAVAQGADLTQVVNAYRGVAPSQRTKMGKTLEVTTRRGYASYLRRAIDREQGRRTVETTTSVGPRGAVRNYTVRRTGNRLSPEGIYAIARNEDEARLLLVKNGYIVGDINQLARSATSQMRALTN